MTKPPKKPQDNFELVAVKMPKPLIEAVDTLAERQYRTRSDVIRQGALRELAACEDKVAS
jgi:metal-responsive CopG/Arc/MetJ family transcriptional regulator